MTLPTEPPFSNHDDLANYVRFLMERVDWLEGELLRLQASKLPRLKSVHYHIDKLYVRELSGTLNIGITSIGDNPGVTDLTDLTDLPGGAMDEELEAFDDEVNWFTTDSRVNPEEIP